MCFFLCAPQIRGNMLPQVVLHRFTLNQLRAYLAQVTAIYANGIANGEDVAQAWLKYGDVGASSSFMCKALSGLPFDDSEVYAPADYDDFQRCEKMLDIVPGLREKIALLSTFPCYRGLAKSWDQLASMHQIYQTNKSKWPSKDEWSHFQSVMEALRS